MHVHSSIVTYVHKMFKRIGTLLLFINNKIGLLFIIIIIAIILISSLV